MVEFYAADGTVLSLSWKGAKGEVLHVAVLDPEMEAVDTAAYLKGSKIKRLPLPSHGRYAIEVTTTAGAGQYVLKARRTVRL